MKPRLQDTGVIEFFGLPGSGKTTAANALLDCSRVRSSPLSRRVVGLSEEGRLARSLFKGRLIARHPHVSARILRECLRVWRHVDRDRRRRFLLSVLNMMFVASLLHSGRAERPLILDQGFFQACWGMLRILQLEYRSQLNVEYLFNLAFKNIDNDELHVIHVRCDGHEAKRRAEARDGKHDGASDRFEKEIAQGEACRLLVMQFIERLLHSGKLGANHDWGNLTLGTMQLNRRVDNS